MRADSKLARVILVSPWFLLIFLVIPLFVVLNVTLHIRLPLVGTGPLLFNNLVLTAVIGLRFLRYLLCLRKPVRYGAASGRPRRAEVLPLSADQAREALEREGYAFAPDGAYGERRELGYLGTLLLYGGLFLLLFVGTWDNLCQFSGTILDGVGQATRLSSVEAYRTLIMGPLAAQPVSLPKLRIESQIIPGPEHRKGATEISLIDAKGRVQRTLLAPTDPFRYGGYDIYMAKFVFEPQILIKSKDGVPLFQKKVKLNPLWRKEAGYGFYGPIATETLDGEVFYQPEKSLLKVVLNRDGKELFNGEMVFQVQPELAKGDYVLSCDRMGHWTEIHVVRRRHTELLWLGGALALLGLVLRLGIRSQRVWLEPAPEGCRVAARGGAMKLLQGKGA